MGLKKRKMAAIKEKLAMEVAKMDNEIILHREGVFYIMYEQSAWLFTHSVHAYKVKKAYIKCVASDVISIGFPMTSLCKFTNDCKLVDDGAVVHMFLPMERIPVVNDFENWKNKQPSYAQKEIRASGDVADSLAIKLELLDKIDSFPIESKSPIECMLFLSEIKTKYKNL